MANYCDTTRWALTCVGSSFFCVRARRHSRTPRVFVCTNMEYKYERLRAYGQLMMRDVEALFTAGLPDVPWRSAHCFCCRLLILPRFCVLLQLTAGEHGNRWCHDGIFIIFSLWQLYLLSLLSSSIVVHIKVKVSVCGVVLAQGHPGGMFVCMSC